METVIPRRRRPRLAEVRRGAGAGLDPPEDRDVEERSIPMVLADPVIDVGLRSRFHGSR